MDLIREIRLAKYSLGEQLGEQINVNDLSMIVR